MNKNSIYDRNSKRKYTVMTPWMSLKCETVTPDSELYKYAEEGEVWSFEQGNETRCLAEFHRLTIPIMLTDTQDGKMIVIEGYDSRAEMVMHPDLIEIQEDGESVRLWKESSPIL